MTFDVQQATDTYINSLGIEALAKATAYTSGYSLDTSVGLSYFRFDHMGVCEVMEFSTKLMPN